MKDTFEVGFLSLLFFEVGFLSLIQKKSWEFAPGKLGFCLIKLGFCPRQVGNLSLSNVGITLLNSILETLFMGYYYLLTDKRKLDLST